MAKTSAPQNLMISKNFPSQNSSTTINSMKDKEKFKPLKKKLFPIGHFNKFESSRENSKGPELMSMTSEKNHPFRSNNLELSRKDSKGQQLLVENNKNNLTKDSKDSELHINKKKPRKILHLISGLIF